MRDKCNSRNHLLYGLEAINFLSSRKRNDFPVDSKEYNALDNVSKITANAIIDLSNIKEHDFTMAITQTIIDDFIRIINSISRFIEDIGDEIIEFHELELQIQQMAANSADGDE